jgi:hypothetical protein
LKATPKSEPKEKQLISVSLDEEDKDNVIDILDEDDDDDEKLRFNMKALNLEPEDESKDSSSKTPTFVKPVVSHESTPTISSSTSKLSSKHKRIDVLEEYKKRNANKLALNLVVIGECVNFFVNSVK